MKKTSIALLAATSVAALFAASSAFAAQNVANTSQKGSLLIWPKISVDPGVDTIVEISNDSNFGIHLYCEYVNEAKGRAPFDLFVSGKGTVSWDVRTQTGDHAQPPPFPTNIGGGPALPAGIFADANRGELVCFATEASARFQVAWNELTGTGTYLDLANGSPGVVQPRQGFKYNAWAFAARCAPTTSSTSTCPASGLAPDSATVEQGTPGDLVLSGGGDGNYDACPVYNIVNFMPYGATLGNISAGSQWLSVSGCDQDLREKYNLHLTKLFFSVFNAAESSFNAYACVDSVNTIPLDAENQPPTPIVNQASSFDFSTLTTPNARFQVQGISSAPPCPAASTGVFENNVGLVGVYNTWVGIDGDIPGIDQDIGNTTQGAGAHAPGFVMWDVAGGTPPAAK